MDEVQSGALAPEVNAPAADAVPTPDVPVVQENVEGKPTEPVQPRTYTEDEHKELVAKQVNERLTKERRRIERAVRAEAERDFYKQQLETRTTQPPAERPPGRPRQEDFVGRPFDEYLDAVTDWKLEQRLAKQQEESQQQSVQQRQAQQAEANAQFVKDKIVDAGVRKFPDFIDTVMGEDVDGITEPMVVAAAKLSNGIDVLYHLGKNESERYRIASLSPIEQAWEMKDIAQKLKAPPKPTQTPPPIVPNGQKASVEKRLEDASIDEFFAIRRKQIAAKRGR